MSSQTLLLGAAFPSPALALAPSRSRSRRLRIRAQVEPSDKSVEIMRKFSEQYARKSGTYFCMDKGVTAVVIKGLAEHKDSIGAPLCPCRHYDDKAAEVGQGFWNCPCVPMRERKECHCMLFLTPENDFAGKEQACSLWQFLLFNTAFGGLPSPWKRSKKRRQNSEVVALFVDLHRSISINIMYSYTRREKA
ncbi:Ferredoxin-thioredoxin reductase catalytic chain, chloroplastic [Ananas comosus]|uniref:Ferredoxin-thioredoxin reductase catalytic chain, chloroplastic n=1 Tax=Ananas comosus TaxID=4615 RepID=A0A199UPU7_ANACO|nr:Ferredoxin-thioredoxin reductase catalytic chain, chloroplastic [Ananas comosus]